MAQQRVKGRIGAALLAVGLVTLGAGMSFGTAIASGEFTTVTLTSPTSGTSTTFTWSYSFSKNDGHGLSNIAVKFCSQEVLDHVVSASPAAEIFKASDVPGGHTGFGHGIKFGVTAETGTLLVTFDQPLAIGGNGVFVQSHSGDGQEGDQITSGDGPLCDPATTTTTVPPVTTTLPPVTTTVPPVTTTLPPVTTTVPPVTTTLPPVTTTLPPGPTTTVPPVTTTVPPGPTTTVAGATTTSAPPAAFVLGVSERNTVPGAIAGASLAKTGGAAIPLVVGLGVLLTVLGFGLVVGEYVARPAH